MPSMSYLPYKFENTAAALEQCTRCLYKARRFDDLDINGHETDAMIKMVGLCEEFVKQYKRLTEVEEFEITVDL